MWIRRNPQRVAPFFRACPVRVGLFCHHIVFSKSGMSLDAGCFLVRNSADRVFGFWILPRGFVICFCCGESSQGQLCWRSEPLTRLGTTPRLRACWAGLMPARRARPAARACAHAARRRSTSKSRSRARCSADAASKSEVLRAMACHFSRLSPGFHSRFSAGSDASFSSGVMASRWR